MKMQKEHIRMVVQEPDDSNQPAWIKDVNYFTKSQVFDNLELLNIGHVIEDDFGNKYLVTGVLWTFDKDKKPVMEITTKRFTRLGKQNPFML